MEKRASPIYIASSQIYALATSKDNYFDRIREYGLSMLLDGHSDEMAAITDESTKRKEEKSSENTVELKTKAELLEYVDKAQRDFIRPEIVSKVLKDNIEVHFSEQSYAISSQITKCEESFDKEYKKMIGNMRQIHSSAFERVKERYDNSGASTGLGFGIITNSPSQAMLYGAMDAHARKKQESANFNAISVAARDSNGRLVLQFHDRFVNLFKDYIDKVRDVIKEM